MMEGTNIQGVTEFFCSQRCVALSQASPSLTGKYRVVMEHHDKFPLLCVEVTLLTQNQKISKHYIFHKDIKAYF